MRDKVIKKRFETINDAERTLDAYLDGAKYCVSGHFAMYPPTRIGEINFNLKEEIKSQIFEKNNKPVGLYIHWPFCYLPDDREKCYFCCSNARNDSKSKMLKGKYYGAIINEIKTYASMIGSNPVEWIYIGGGTPFTIKDDDLDNLFNLLYTTGMVNKGTFITIESRPEMVTEQKAAILKKYNIGRVSMGVESLNNDIAITMGRVEKNSIYKEIVKNAVGILRKYEIPFLNLDIIYGHPKDTMDTVMESIEYASMLEPDSISAYAMGMPLGLTLIEKDARNGMKLKEKQFRLDAYNNINKFLKTKGYDDVYDCIWSKYQVDSYRTITGGKGIVNMWNQTCVLPYGIWLGVGIGADGYIGGVGPTENTNDLEEYIELANKGEVGVTKAIKYDFDNILRSEIVLSLLHRTIDSNRFEKVYSIHPLDAFPLN